MAGRFTESEIAIIKQTIAANPADKQRTMAKHLLSSNLLPGRTFFSIYSRIRELSPKTAAPSSVQNDTQDQTAVQ